MYTNALDIPSPPPQLERSYGKMEQHPLVTTPDAPTRFFASFRQNELTMPNNNSLIHPQNCCILVFDAEIPESLHKPWIKAASRIALIFSGIALLYFKPFAFSAWIGAALLAVGIIRAFEGTKILLRICRVPKDSLP